jgi:hypothetical protein
MIFSVMVNTRPREAGSTSEALPKPTSWACRNVPDGWADTSDEAARAATATKPANLFILCLLDDS